MRKQHFTIVVPAYNVENWALKNIRSIMTQNYDNYDILYVNDASTDNTKKLADDLFRKYSNESTALSYQVTHNTTNKKALQNIYDSVSKAKDGSVIITLDGDDWLAGKDVLNKLNQVYQDPNAWMSAGSYLENTTMAVRQPKVYDDFWKGNLRRHLWTISHLRTFKKELFMKINREDMLDHDGEMYKFTFDRAMMYPMIEMSGPEHYRTVLDVLCIYNRENPLAVDRVHRAEQLRIEREIANRKPYERLENL